MPKERFILVRQVDAGNGWFDVTAFQSAEAAGVALHNHGRDATCRDGNFSLEDLYEAKDTARKRSKKG